MLRRLLAPTLSLLPLTCGCADNEFERIVLATNAESFSLCCDDQTQLPLQVGSFGIQIFRGQLGALDESSLSATFTLVDPITPVRLSVASGDALSLNSTQVDVFVDDCDFEQVEVRFVADVSGRNTATGRLEVITLTESFTVTNTGPPIRHTSPTTPLTLLEAIVGDAIPEGLSLLSEQTPVGVATCNPNSLFLPQVPDAPGSEVFSVGSAVVTLDAERIDELFVGSEDPPVPPILPEGVGPLGRTVVAEVPAGTPEMNVPFPPPAGDYLVAWQCTLADVPFDGARNLLYSLYLETDGDPMNDFMSPPPFEKGAFSDTDLWIQLQNLPAMPGRDAIMNVSEISSGNMIAPALTATRAIVADQVVMFLIPVADAGPAMTASGRFEAFVHDGDFGLLGGDYSIDVTPPVGETMRTFDLGPPDF